MIWTRPEAKEIDKVPKATKMRTAGGKQRRSNRAPGSLALSEAQKLIESGMSQAAKEGARGKRILDAADRGANGMESRNNRK
jgi:hypothetical protein